MRRNVASRMGALLLTCAATSPAWGDEPPATVDIPPLLPPPIEAPASREIGPVLVVPGVPTSASPRSRPGAAAPEPSTPVAGGDLPALIGPSEMPEPGLAGSARRDAPAMTSRVDIPLELDWVPDPVVPDPPRARTSPLREAPPPVRRGPRFFGRFAPPSSSTGRGSTPTRGPASDEPMSKSDPAADAERKRRIEREVRETLGDRVRSTEVRVVGRNVAIRAEASRFWQRRSVRRALESLPGLAGYRTTIDVGD